MGKSYPLNFKKALIVQVLEHEKSVSELAKGNNIAPSTIHRWLREERLEVLKRKNKYIYKKLEQDIEKLAEERGVLLKAMAIFAKEHSKN